MLARPPPCAGAFDGKTKPPTMSTTLLFAAAAAEPSSTAAFLFQTFPLVLVFVIFYLLMIRPQQRQMKAHNARIAAVKKGDKVVTGGGLLGRVTRVTDGEVEVDLGNGLKVNAVKSSLSQVIDPSAKPAND